MDVVGYGVEPEDLKALREMCQRLYSEGPRLSADRLRDIANAMHVIVWRIEQEPIRQ